MFGILSVGAAFAATRRVCRLAAAGRIKKTSWVDAPQPGRRAPNSPNLPVACSALNAIRPGAMSTLAYRKAGSHLKY